MITETPNYQTQAEAFQGMSKTINGSHCPASWKDVFVLNDRCGRAHIVPSVSVVLSEVGSGEWVFRTICGDFKPISKAPILEMIMEGTREFAVIPTTYELELQKA